MRQVRFITAILVIIAGISSCEMVSNLIHDDEVVARIGKNKLYRSQLEEFIPKSIPAEDSVNLARQYINSWAMEQLYIDVAGTRLSKSEMDVSKELEDYRKSLLKFRYEQRYLSDRLDTCVTHSEIEEYYNGHQDLFILEAPVVKARFMDIMKEAPNVEAIKKKMASSTYSDLAAADSLAYTSALRYEDRSDEWVDARTYAKNFGTDYGTLLSKLKPDGFVEMEGEGGDLKIGYICSMGRAGTVAPAEFCEQRIKDIIINNRKRQILTTLEQDLLDDALENEKLIIY